MGNVLSAAVPSLIQPIEAYLGDIGDLHFNQSLGSTRFLKVGKAIHDNEGLCVVKVFVLHDPSFHLRPYRDQIDSVRHDLQSATNCSPFQKVVITDKAAILIREFGRDTLYDRLSTRPFLLDIEKRWIAFQLLKALEQCYVAKVCHGDIKSHNIIVTGSNWALLTDFASFKPAYLPYDNPSDFTYFFDASRRRTCYLAPERFLSTKEVASSSPSGLNDPLVTLPEEHCTASQLTHAMDVFSLGCVIAELFMDGTPAFDFAQLLTFRQKGDWTSGKHLPQVPGLKELIVDMIARDPGRRLTAPKLLEKYRGKFFPEVFYGFLYPYLEGFAKHPLLSDDDKMQKIKGDCDKTFGVFTDVEGRLDPSSIMSVSLATSVVRSLKHSVSKMDALGLMRRWGSVAESDWVLNRILPYSLYLVNDTFARVRAEAVQTSAYLLTKINNLPRDDSKLFINYVFPKLNAVVHDPSSLVRIALASNVSLLAETAGRFLELASKHILVGDKDVEEKETATLEVSRQNYLRMELKELQDTLQELLVTLLCDSDNNIKRALVHEGRLPKLCAFFGKQRASDVLLSHMITFLNDKTDWLLRAKFYETIPAAAAFIGWQSTLILKPLLQQKFLFEGLRDFEEMVVFRTLTCLSSLSKLRLLQKPAVYELLQDAIPFLAHPNECLRISAVSFLRAVAKALNMADIHCKVMPLVSPYLTQPLIKLDQQAVLLRCLCSPVPRGVWDMVVRSQLTSDLMDFLRDKNLLRQLSPNQGLFSLGDVNEPNFLTGNTSPTAGAMFPESVQLKLFYQKLLNQGLTEEMEEKLLAFREILMKMRKMKASVSDDLSPTETWKPGTVDLSCLSVTRRFADLTTSRRIRQHGRKHKKAVKAGDMNEEWQEMFGAKPPSARQDTDESPRIQVSEPALEEVSKRIPPSPSGGELSEAISEAMGVEARESVSEAGGEGEGEKDVSRLATLITSKVASLDVSQSEESTSLLEVSEGDGVTLDDTLTVSQSVEHSGVIDTSPAMDTQLQMSSCRSQLTELVEWKRSEWHRAARFASSALKGEDSSEEDLRSVGKRFVSKDFSPPIDWRVEGRLVANLHEHRGAVTKLAMHPDKRLFLSSSADGTVKLWDSHRMEGKSMANRSRFTYTGLGDRVRCVSFLDSGERFVCCGDSCTVKVVPVEKTDPNEEGALLDLDTWTDGCTDLIVGVTHHGYLMCWDLRAGEKAVWRCQNQSEHGLVTGFCLDRVRQQWACLATMNGRMITWDTRFQLPVNVCCHPSGQRVVRLWSADGFGGDGSQYSNVWASLAGNGEVGLWNLESGGRSRAIWPSENPPLSYQQNSGLCTGAFYCRFEGSKVWTITGDSFGALRRWDLTEPKASGHISSATQTTISEKASSGKSTHLYKNHMIEGTEVLMEQKLDWGGKKAQGIYAGSGAASPEEIRVSTWHRDSVSDLGVCFTGEQWFLASASRDGVIKVWK